MKMAAPVLALLALVCGASAASGPVAIHPACLHIECGEISCLSPFVMERKEGQCCPICHDPTGAISSGDRGVTGLTGEFVRPLHPAAPGMCAGAKCFAPQCATGYTPGHVQGRCCEACVPGR
mmetsp:Transcript_16358/g.37729  ORF Transcript_16358/g.37729 Transcript_16358/m.37729 type:complete len:122 (-) Transcript_16358:47-412(-)